MAPLMNKIATSVIGHNQILTTPFGEKPLIYADYTASGRSLSFIENYIAHHVLPFYANTHTETSATGAQTTKFREEARTMIKQAVNGKALDSVIFCGSGATAAINKIIDILGLQIPRGLDDIHHFSQQIPPHQKPVVFVGPYEHHSNELPWRESIADVVAIPLDSNGQINTDILKHKLLEYQDRPLKIGSFSAASNVTGVISDTGHVTHILKSHNALSFWDYAAAAPYTKINMNTAHPFDAVFISPHKFIGGPGTPGILVVKNAILSNRIPSMIGGGTVSYVTPSHHVYIDDHERREEGGTPAIVESIRAGLVFKLQQEVGIPNIEKTEKNLVDKAMAVFSKTPQLEVLGNNEANRLSIFSLRFKHADKDLHYGFITALLNDLFGIQVRGGCSCAGPYGHSLLGINEHDSKNIEHQIQQGYTFLRPGWVRLNFNYFIPEVEFTYILNAIQLVAQHGWKMLPFYQLDQISGNWLYQGKLNNLPHSLLAFSFLDTPQKTKIDTTADFDALFNQANQTLTEVGTLHKTFSLQLPPAVEKLRWFALPSDCLSQ
jgi:selenocysteine lyase/cysteine desulfurase